jgi:thiamine pyrophosphate-dependent acetolactate synthase large subunit-like protein
MAKTAGDVIVETLIDWGVDTVFPESGVKIAISDLDRRQSVNLAQDAIGQIL